MSPERFAVAVDAGSLVRDRRGMGRLVRGALRFFGRQPGVCVTLLATRRDAIALRAEFSREAFSVASMQTARRPGRYDAVWFPFNGMRYVPRSAAVVTIHDVFAFTQPCRGAVARYREQAPVLRAARVASRIAVDSRWTSSEFERVLGARRRGVAPVVVPPAADAFFYPETGDRPPAPLDTLPYVLLVGAREPRKNARLALVACAQALRGAETLVIAGNLTAADRGVARRLGLNCGEISPSDDVLRSLYRNARLVLVPSLAEGFGLVAVEALACGAPVLASNAAALPEATRGAAELLDPHDAALWSRTIRAYLDDPARAAVLRARSDAAFAAHDRDAFARTTLALLREAGR